MVAKSDPYIGARVQSPDGGTDLVIAAGGALVLETGAKLYSGTSDVTGNLTGGGGSSGLVPLPGYPLAVTDQPFVDITIPSDDTQLLAYISGLNFSVSDYLAGSFSFDGGGTFLNDVTHFDSYYITGVTVVVTSVVSVLGADSLILGSGIRQDATSSLLMSAALTIIPGSSVELPQIVFHLTGMDNADPPQLTSFPGTACVNPSATTPPVAARATTLRLSPYGNGDSPPTSGRTMSMSLTVYGVPAP